MKIPKIAKKVFTGKIFDVFQWQQKMFDGSFQTFERIKRPDTVQVIAIEEGKILICRETQPDRPEGYTLIGGRVDPGEDALTAAKRELKEESGYESEDWELWRTYTPDSKIEWDIYVYIARGCKKTSEQDLDSGEKIIIEKVDIDGLVKVMESPMFSGTEIAYHILSMNLNGEIDEFRKKLFR